MATGDRDEGGGVLRFGGGPAGPQAFSGVWAGPLGKRCWTLRMNYALGLLCTVCFPVDFSKKKKKVYRCSLILFVENT